MPTPPHRLAVHLDRQEESRAVVRRHGDVRLCVLDGIGAGEGVSHMAGDTRVVGMAGKEGGVVLGPVAED